MVRIILIYKTWLENNWITFLDFEVFFDDILQLDLMFGELEPDNLNRAMLQLFKLLRSEFKVSYGRLLARSWLFGSVEHFLDEAFLFFDLVVAPLLNWSEDFFNGYGVPSIF